MARHGQTLVIDNETRVTTPRACTRPLQVPGVNVVSDLFGLFVPKGCRFPRTGEYVQASADGWGEGRG